MARIARLDFDGAFHHVTNRGNRGADIFLDDADRRAFLGHLAEAARRHGWHCHGYCLMGNHYHLLLETPQATLSRGMQWLSSVTTQRFNRRHEVRGHLFQGRFHSVLVERDSHFLQTLRYIALNPVRAGLVARAGDWPWSHHRALAGLAPAPESLSTEGPWQQIAPDIEAVRRVYAEFVAEGGGDGETGTPAAARRTEDLAALARAGRSGRAWMVGAHLEHGFSQAAIAREAGVHRATVCRLIGRARAKS